MLFLILLLLDYVVSTDTLGNAHFYMRADAVTGESPGWPCP